MLRGSAAGRRLSTACEPPHAHTRRMLERAEPQSGGAVRPGGGAPPGQHALLHKDPAARSTARSSRKLRWPSPASLSAVTSQRAYHEQSFWATEIDAKRARGQAATRWRRQAAGEVRLRREPGPRANVPRSPAAQSQTP